MDLHCGQYSLTFTERDSGCCGQTRNFSYTVFSKTSEEDSDSFSKNSIFSSSSSISVNNGYVIFPEEISILGATIFSFEELIFLISDKILSVSIEVLTLVFSSIAASCCFDLFSSSLDFLLNKDFIISVFRLFLVSVGSVEFKSSFFFCSNFVLFLLKSIKLTFSYGMPNWY